MSTDKQFVANTKGGESSWTDWQQRVVAIIQRDFAGVLDRVEVDDIDWDAWRPLFDEGRSPKAAVTAAFGKVA